MGKNCGTCKHLEWHDDADSDGNTGPASGFGCGKRDPGSEKAERLLLQNLQRTEYRERYKTCFEPKGAA